MMLRVSLVVLALMVGCTGGGGSMPQAMPDASMPKPDAPKPPDPPPPPPKRAYGQACTNGNDCQSGLCVGTGNNFMCSRSCSLQVAFDCKNEDAFCVPLDASSAACYGMIETGNDNDDAIVEIGDSVTRVLTPLNDTDIFQVRLNTLGKTTFTATPEVGIDVRIQAFSVLGEPLAIANNGAAGVAEALETNVQQIGSHIWVAVTNVGQSTGGFTLSVAHLANATSDRDDLAGAGAETLLRAELAE
jgi:hypothetical protein